MAQLNFDATNVQPSTGTGDPIPAGWYNAAIDESEMKPTKTGDGQYLTMRFNILDGQFANRKVYTLLNVKNNNAQAVEIAYKDLSAICHAVGVMQVQDSQQLHGKPLKIRVSVSPATAEYEARNNIKAFKNINEQVGNTAPAATGGGAPWLAAPAPVQQPAWAPAAAPQAAPATYAPPAQFATPQQAPAAPAAPVQQAWQPPATQQPWAQAPVAAPVQQPMQQPAQAPVAAPVAGAMPPWMAQTAQAPAVGAAPPWAQQPAQ
jgi:Protein of unknown function (DUF669)